ncbi:sulfate permease, SulP family [Lentzea fradiae]|uniref:Sulfate permease, SulP family n=1 Tax=Lentzea fradiae TaxID=200378 RepID=A0A1G7KW16_9PSEU|nr:SulP family inorganic anion transporter [Lentzea fradiae]SDF41427.1 sulfate permease, SulP family [Lentzea fradiae]
MSSFRASQRPALSQRVRTTWFSNPRADLLSGLVVALALIPEALSFSVIAGVDPKVGLYASFTIAIIIAFAGGRPAMISAATGAMALVLVQLVRDHGIEFMFAATVLTGAFQILFGLVGVHRLMRFVPRTVMVGFVNALAILLFAAQIPHITGGGWPVIALAVLGLAIIYLLPRLTKAVPAPLVAIVVVTALTVFLHIGVPTVGDQGELPTALPGFGLPLVPFTLDTLAIITPYALTLAAVGLIESLLTAQLLDDITDTGSDKGREVRGQGIANIATGFFGGMAGCAMIGQSMINVKSGGRTRLSTLAAGVFLLILVFVLGPVVSLIPMAALVAVMVFVSVSTFDWSSIKPSTLRRTPKSETAVMVVTVATVVATHNLALGVLAGALLSAIFFARRVAHLVDVSSALGPDGGVRVYTVTGELFFASTNELVRAFDHTEDVAKVVIDLSGAHVWDSSAVATLDAVTAKFAARGVETEIVGLNAASEHLHAKLSGQLSGSH